MKGDLMKYELGIELRDIVTGYTGMVMGRTNYLTGCNHYGLAASNLTKEGKVREWEWFDESRLIPTGKKLKSYKAPNTSGPVPAAPEM